MATSLSVKPCSQYGNRNAPQGADLGGVSHTVHENRCFILPPIV
nr:MAG TPA: hypothetical protein [Caudoviricetes sp.]